MEQDRYPIAICMAGAVSAGAYSAGAMSVLLQALRRWENAELALPKRPKHRIEIKGMSGASAGSVQAALSSLDIFSSDTQQELGVDAWFSVSISKLLETQDLDEPDAAVKSALNSNYFRELTTEVLAKHSWSTAWPSYVSPNYEIRLSVTNLRGVPYNIALPKLNRTEFGMSHHNEYLHYRFVPNDSEPHSEPVYYVQMGNDAGLPELANGALASSAFPLAFEPIKVNRPTLISNEDIHDQRKWLAPETVEQQPDHTKALYKENTCPPQWNSQYGNKESFYAVDGGATNNEPLLEAFKLLFGDKLADWGDLSDVNKPDKRKDGRVLLIDPFPNSLDLHIKEDAMRLDKILGMLKSTLIRHARFSEPIMVSERLKERVGLVYPSNPLRDPADNDQRPEDQKMLSIKSGALSGFAGFLKRDFLEHDYELGRLNMRRFLRYHFSWPIDHPRVKDDQTYIDAWSFHDEKRNEQRVPIIPVYSKNNDDFVIFEAPNSDREEYYRTGLQPFQKKFTQDDKKSLTKGLSKRLGVVVTKLMHAHNVGRLVVWGWQLFGKKTLSKKIVQTVETSLEVQDLIEK